MEQKEREPLTEPSFKYPQGQEKDMIPDLEEKTKNLSEDQKNSAQRENDGVQIAPNLRKLRGGGCRECGGNGNTDP